MLMLNLLFRICCKNIINISFLDNKSTKSQKALVPLMNLELLFTKYKKWIIKIQ